MQLIGASPLVFMATYLQNLETRRNAVAAELALMVSASGQPDGTKAGANPNSTGGSIDVDHQGHRKELMDELKMLSELIDDVRSTNDGVPFEVTSEATV